MNAQPLENPDALKAIKWDIAHSSLAYAQTYLLEEKFFDELFHVYLLNFDLHILTDHRQKPIAKQLLARYNHLHIRTWSTNRTMHTKTLLFWPSQSLYCGSHNLTRGSFSMSANTTIRIETPAIFSQYLTLFKAMYDRSRPVTPD